MTTCDCQINREIDISPEQLESIPRIARAMIAEALAEQNRKAIVTDDQLALVHERLPGIVSDLVHEHIAESVALAVRRVRGRID